MKRFAISIYRPEQHTRQCWCGAIYPDTRKLVGYPHETQACSNQHAPLAIERAQFTQRWKGKR